MKLLLSMREMRNLCKIFLWEISKEKKTVQTGTDRPTIFKWSLGM
jgi:hypothetical protein